jgi:hypothetical protein
LEFSIGIFAETTIAASGFAPVKLPSGLGSHCRRLP